MAAPSTSAHAAKKTGRPVGFAVFPPLLKGRPDPAIAQRLVDSLETEGKSGPSRVLTDRRLQRRLRQDPQALLSKCNAETLTDEALGCVAKVAKKAAPHAVIIMVDGIENEVKATFKVVDTATATVVRTLVVQIASVTDATMAMDTRAKKVLGFEEDQASPTESDPPLPLAEVDAGTETPGSDLVPPPEEGAETDKKNETEDPLAVMDGMALEPPPPTPEASLQLEPPPPRDHTLTYIGAGVGGAGVLLAITGMGYGIKSQKLEDGINRNTQTQAQGLRRYRDAEDASKRANAFLALGAITTAGGVGLILWNTVFRDPASDVVEVTAAPTEGGAQGALLVRW